MGWYSLGALGHTLIAAATSTSTAASDVNVIEASFESFMLGIVQGITEFLPISSTAHLLIVTRLFGWGVTGQKTFVDAIQFGSVIAVVWYFWTDIYQILTGAWSAFRQQDWQREEWKILVGIIVGTIPALSAGFVLKKLNLLPDGVMLIAVMSIVMSLLLALAEKLGSRKRGFDDLQIGDGILVGLGQMIALLPGASRSGSTLTTGLFLGLERQTAARFSFLLGIPTLTIATLVQAKDSLSNSQMLIPLLVGIFSSFIFSYLSIAWLLRFLQRQSTWVFVWYRLAFGVALLAALAGGIFQQNS
ncbi:undecaprenyl-diphosphatase [Stenomitos frigidus ULC18]|uniref:Undecaprenyl-diphosphatase n=2 Tax=Stenomitos TaxID=1844270 RepID=A0A2T1E9D6_9CYAN|nr:undecaprenyl-diphosphatase [Stenomitos frigidus ULC18]